MIADRPSLSVVVRLIDDARAATTMFAALAASTLPRHRWELIVVATTDSPPCLAIAAQYADAIVRMSGPWTPSSAYVCNRGASVASGPVIVFLGHDVTVLPNTLARIDAAFADEELSALVGAIGPAPREASMPTRFRALVREWMHLRGTGTCEHFATSCGAIRTGAFFAAGQLDEWQRPPLGCASRELGLRLRALGYRIELRDDVRVSSRRSSSWLDAVRPLMIVAPTPPWMPRSVATSDEALARLRARERRLSSMATAAVVLGLAGGVLRDTALLIVAASVTTTVIAFDMPLLSYVFAQGGFGVFLAALPLRFISLLTASGSELRDGFRYHIIGEPRTDPGVEALHEVGARAWPPTPARPRVGEPTAATTPTTAAPRPRAGDAT